MSRRAKQRAVALSSDILFVLQLHKFYSKTEKWANKFITLWLMNIITSAGLVWCSLTELKEMPKVPISLHSALNVYTACHSEELFAMYIFTLTYEKCKWKTLALSSLALLYRLRPAWNLIIILLMCISDAQLCMLTEPLNKNHPVWFHSASCSVILKVIMGHNIWHCDLLAASQNFV